MRMIVLIFCTILSLSNAFSNETVAKLPLRGEGNYKWFFLHVYEAKLWAEQGDELYKKPLSLELKYARSFKAKDIVDQSIKEMKNFGVIKSDLDDLKLKLLDIFPDVREGDVISANYGPETGVRFYLNSTIDLGQLSDVRFSKIFLDIWLGENTSSPELTNKLLGKK